MSSKSDKPLPLVAVEEEDQISRNVLIWLSTFPGIPDLVLAENPMIPINFEFLKDNSPGMALSTIQSPYITKRYILGGYQAEYQFKVIYRIIPGITPSPDRRLKADELLDRLGDWARRGKPDLGKGIRPLRVEATTRASKFAEYENGDEDHQILMKMTYEVI
ncbi:hypothetical protein AALC17_01655 [Oscillospiraceae bacterium 38-13]